MIKKFAVFFATGGENVCWFGLLYPDKDGKSHGSAGDSHNVFDCRFNRYAPRLDAVTYYHAVNAISIKKFIEERRYDGDIDAFLFRDRDNRCLQILWQDKNQTDVFVPLVGVNDVEVLQLDGSRTSLNAGGKGLTLRVSNDPLLLLYESADSSLPEKLEAPEFHIAQHPERAPKNSPIEIAVTAGNAEALELTAPPRWTVVRSESVFRAVPPPATAVREAEFSLQSTNSNGEIRFRIAVER